MPGQNIGNIIYGNNMKITLNLSAINSPRCRRGRAILNLVTERDGLSCNFEFVV